MLIGKLIWVKSGFTVQLFKKRCLEGVTLNSNNFFIRKVQHLKSNKSLNYSFKIIKIIFHFSSWKRENVKNIEFFHSKIGQFILNKYFSLKEVNIKYLTIFCLFYLKHEKLRTILDERGTNSGKKCFDLKREKFVKLIIFYLKRQNKLLTILLRE